MYQRFHYMNRWCIRFRRRKEDRRVGNSPAPQKAKNRIAIKAAARVRAPNWGLDVRPKRSGWTCCLVHRSMASDAGFEFEGIFNYLR